MAKKEKKSEKQTDGFQKLLRHHIFTFGLGSVLDDMHDCCMEIADEHLQTDELGAARYYRTAAHCLEASSKYQKEFPIHDRINNT